ncbi:60S ribosomal protein L10A [Conglomerata obtusa]
MSSIFTKERLIPLIQQTITEKLKTVDCQLTLKNYDFKKDVRFDSNILLPHHNRTISKVLILADKNIEEVCKANDLPYILLDDIQGTTAEKKKQKKKLARKYEAFVSIPAFNKAFEMRILACKNKPVYTVKNASEVKAMYEEVRRTVKFKLRKSVNFGFAIGNTKMGVEELSENMAVAINHFVGLLKKGMQNVQSVYVKSNQGKAIKVYG